IHRSQQLVRWDCSPNYDRSPGLAHFASCSQKAAIGRRLIRSGISQGTLTSPIISNRPFVAAPDDGTVHYLLTSRHLRSGRKAALIWQSMNFFVQRSELRDIYDKVAAGERISEDDALRLFESKDLNAVGAIADFAREKKVGNRAS